MNANGFSFIKLIQEEFDHSVIVYFNNKLYKKNKL